MDDDDAKVTENRRRIIMVKGPVIVDPEAFLQFASDSLVLGEKEPFETGDLYGAEVTEAKEENAPTPDQLLLCPSRILGYSTRAKIWGQFNVDRISDVPDPSITLFKDKLQLDPNLKDMIQALVEEHGARGGQNDPNRVKVKDVVEDKGKGLVLLLHGPPGVGKTVRSQSSLPKIITSY